MTDQLNQIQNLLTQMAEQQAQFQVNLLESDARLTRTEKICESNAKAIQANSNAIAELRQTVTDDRDAAVSAELDLHTDLVDLKQEMRAGFQQLGANIQTLTNAVFSLLQEIAALQRRAS